MPALTLSEHFKIAALSVDRKRRAAVTRALSSPLLSWRYGSLAPDQVLIVPQDLRTADPSFWAELSAGYMGLAGVISDLRGASPFRVTPPTLDWECALHGFGWLRHLAATDEPEAFQKGRELALDWIASDDGQGVAWEPQILARRVISWISHTFVLLEGAEPATYSTITRSLGRQVVRLAGTWRMAPDGYPRLFCLISLVLADLAVVGHDKNLQKALQQLSLELKRQFLPGGSHASRNAQVLVEILVDLLPLSQCFKSRGREPLPEISKTIRKAIVHLRQMRLGDGMLARFNGVGVAAPAGLATVLPYGDPDDEELRHKVTGGYVRLERGRSIVVVDSGSPPQLAFAAEASAGCLSFEMSSGADLIFVNGGMPGSASRDWEPQARATASHNTLCLAEYSSSKLLQNSTLQSLVGGMPIRNPSTVTCKFNEDSGAAVVETSHDGYMKRFKLVHWRTISLASSGGELAGVDKLARPHESVRMVRSLPFAIHFHLHPDVACAIETTPETGRQCRIKTLSGEYWVFGSEGAEIFVEDSVYFADSAGPRQSLQIVLRAATAGFSEVRWWVRRA